MENASEINQKHEWEARKFTGEKQQNMGILREGRPGQNWRKITVAPGYKTVKEPKSCLLYFFYTSSVGGGHFQLRWSFWHP